MENALLETLSQLDGLSSGHMYAVMRCAPNPRLSTVCVPRSCTGRWSCVCTTCAVGRSQRIRPIRRLKTGRGQGIGPARILHADCRCFFYVEFLNNVPCNRASNRSGYRLSTGECSILCKTVCMVVTRPFPPLPHSSHLFGPSRTCLSSSASTPW